MSISDVGICNVGIDGIEYNVQSYFMKDSVILISEYMPYINILYRKAASCHEEHCMMYDKTVTVRE